MTDVIYNRIEPDNTFTEWISFAAKTALEEEGRTGNICVMVTDGAEIRRLNREFRDTDRETDVLSFPDAEGEAIGPMQDSFLGDIVISLPRAKEQAEEYGHSMKRELMFLTVHGCLHLMGYDHMIPEDEEIMLEKQKIIMERTGVSR